MRLRGMERVLQQQDRNREHARRMDGWVQECQSGNYTNLCMLVSATSIDAILRRNGSTLADLERWKTAAAAKTVGKPDPQVITRTSGCCGNPENCTCDLNCMCECCGCALN